MRLIIVAAGLAMVFGTACVERRLGPQSDPYLRGTITSREAGGYGVRVGDSTVIRTYPRMFVVADSGLGCHADGTIGAAWLSLDGDTRVFDTRAELDTTELVIGTDVSVWIEGLVLESCPPQTYAVSVVIER